MGSSGKVFTCTGTHCNQEGTKMKTTFLLVLIVALMTVDAAPIFGFPALTKPGLKEHGRNKFNAGAGLAVLGLLTGNAGITSLGTNLAGLGLKTSSPSFPFPWKIENEKSESESEK